MEELSALAGLQPVLFEQASQRQADTGETQGGKKDRDSWRLSEPALPAVTGQGEHRYLACIREVKQEEHSLSTSHEETQLLSLVCVPSTASWKVGPLQMAITSPGEGACVRPAVRVRLVKGSLPTSPHEARRLHLHSETLTSEPQWGRAVEVGVKGRQSHLKGRERRVHRVGDEAGSLTTQCRGHHHHTVSGIPGPSREWW